METMFSQNMLRAPFCQRLANLENATYFLIENTVHVRPIEKFQNDKDQGDQESETRVKFFLRKAIQGMKFVYFLFCLALSSSLAFQCGMARYRKARRRFRLVGQVQIHHIIPREMQHHPRLSSFEIDGFANLMFVPVHPDVISIRIASNRISTHDGGHLAYNLHVRNLLDDAQSHNIDAILYHLKQGVRRGRIPW